MNQVLGYVPLCVIGSIAIAYFKWYAEVVFVQMSLKGKNMICVFAIITSFLVQP